MRSLPLFALALLPCALPAQPVVSPAHFAVVEGSGGETLPLGVGPRSRTLQIHDDMVGRPMSVSGLGFRRNAGLSAGAFSVLLSVECSNATTTAASPNTLFSANHGANRTLVVNTKLIDFPAVGTRGAAAPLVSTHVVPFDVPFIYDGHDPLCWDLTVLGNTTPGLVLDGFSGSSTNPPLFRTTFGTGCENGSYRVSLLVAPQAGSFSWSPGRDWLDAIVTGPPNALALVAVGGSNTSWLGVPLPFPIPRSEEGVSGTCYINTDMVIALPALIDSRGGVALSVPLTLDPRMHGVSLFWQAFARVVPANPLGLVASEPTWHQFTAPWGLQPVGAVRNGSGTGPNGAVTPHRGTITEFR